MSFDPASAVDAYVLAGGASRRMGQSKARLRVDGEPLALRLARRLAPRVASVRLVCKPDSGLEDLGLPLVYDAETEPALVHGMRAALGAPGPAWRFLVSCDMPDVVPELVDILYDAARLANAPGAAPRLAGSAAPEPLPSLWHARLVPEWTPEWGFAARDWVRRAGLAVWDVPEGNPWFAHVNTPEELAAWEQRRCRA